MSEHTRAHSRFGGSRSERYMNCAASVGIGETVPDIPSDYAAEGTLAHEIAAFCLTRNLRTSRAPQCDKWIKDGVGEDAVPVDMLDAVDLYLGAVWEEFDRHPDSQLLIEATFQLDVEGAAVGEVFGANDALIFSKADKRLVVFDYKHGYGVSVSSEENAQLKFYALGAIMHTRGATDIELVIVQPRAWDSDRSGEVRRWKWELVDVLDFKVDIEEAIARAKQLLPFFSAGSKPGEYLAAHAEVDGFPVYKTGEWCDFCPAAAVCPAKAKQAIDATGLGFKDVTEITPSSLPTVESLKPEQLDQVLKSIEHFVEWGKHVRAHVEALVRGGTPVPGWKIVTKMARAKWIADDAKIAGWLALQGIDEDLLRPPKLVTITEAERLLKAELGAAEFKAAKETLRLNFTLKEPSGTTLAPASDKRDAVDAVAADFASVNDIAA